MQTIAIKTLALIASLVKQVAACKVAHSVNIKAGSTSVARTDLLDKRETSACLTRKNDARSANTSFRMATRMASGNQNKQPSVVPTRAQLTLLLQPFGLFTYDVGSDKIKLTPPSFIITKEHSCTQI